MTSKESKLISNSGSIFDSPANKINGLQTSGRKQSPRSMTSLSLTPYSPSSPAHHQNWETALSDILGVLRIQYRNENEVIAFLTDANKIKHLQYSTQAKMDWNRRVIKEEMDSGIHCPTRSRRIAKDIAIEYIRRYLDGEEERIEMLNKIKKLQNDKDDNLRLLIDLEKDLKRVKEEKTAAANLNERLEKDNQRYTEELQSMKNENEKMSQANSTASEENNYFRQENIKFRDENKKLRMENQDLRNENGALRTENQKVRHDNGKLREDAEEIRSENLKIRKENETFREENYEIRCDNYKLRDKNDSMLEANSQLRTKNEELLNENKQLIGVNLELRSREEELKLLTHTQLGLLDRKVVVEETSE